MCLRPIWFFHRPGNITRIADEDTDYAASVRIQVLRADTEYHYQASGESSVREHAQIKAKSGGFTTAAGRHKAKAVKFVWGAGLPGQGWGLNPALSIKHVSGEKITGGYVVFDVMAKLNSDFAVFQGDMIYADGALPATKEIPADVGGGTWINEPAMDIVSQVWTISVHSGNTVWLTRKWPKRDNCYRRRTLHCRDPR